ncbi:MAG: cell division protein ZipA [Halomonadaceae bacterium]|nr:MAG: cell division protein ZipA [Halomonadaceae bacterium]
MSLREWLIIIGALVILGVLLDGVRRMLRARRESREFSQGMGSSDLGNSPLDESFNPELPNGGSRVIEPGYDSGEQGSMPPPRMEREPTKYRPTRPITGRPNIAPADVNKEPEPPTVPQSPIDQDIAAFHQAHQPSVDDTPREAGISGDEPLVPADDSYMDDAFDEEIPEPSVSAAYDYEEEVTENLSPVEPSDTTDSDDFSASPDERSERQPPTAPGSTVDELAHGAKNLWHKLRASAQSVTESVEKNRTEPPATPSVKSAGHHKPANKEATAKADDLPSKAPLAGANRPVAEEVIVINVHCKGEGRLPGPALKRLFEGCGMEYGDMGIYHRHEEPDTRSPVQFSVANAVSPGTFRPEEMDAMSSPGISFFLSLPGPDDAMQAFEFMLETAQAVVRNLGGELRDEQRSVMTGQTIEHCRQCIREYERRRHFVRQ